MIWTLLFVAEVCIAVGIVGWSAAYGIPWGVWFGGLPLSQQRFYGLVLLHPDVRCPRAGTWQGVVHFLGRERPYNGDYRRLGAWLFLWAAPRRVGGVDFAFGGAKS